MISSEKTSGGPGRLGFLFYFSVSLLLSLPFLARPLNNPDLFWHLSAGKSIFENLAVPRADFLSWTMRGVKWVDFEWLTQALYYFIHSNWDFAGLYFLKVFLAAANLSVIALIARSSGLASLHLLWLLPLSAASLLVSSDIRPENFSILFFSFTFYLLEKQKTAGLFSPRRLISFFALYLLWANLHGGFLYGLALISFYAAGTFLNENSEYFELKGSKISFFRSRPFFLFLAAAFSATFINPYGFGVYSVILEHFRGSFTLQRHISEWHPLKLSAGNTLPLVALLVMGIVMFLYGSAKTKKKDFTKILPAFFFSWLCLSHMRNIAYGTTIFSFLFYSSAGERFKRALPAFFTAAAVLVFLGVHSVRYVGPLYNNFSFCKSADSSEGLSNFLKKNRSGLGSLKMSNIWEWGGWLGWELHPDYKVFVDGRYIFHGYLEELSARRKYLDSWRESEDRNGFELVLMKPGKTEIKFKNPENEKKTGEKDRVFLPAGKWALVYFDSRIFAAVKRDSVSPEWLKENEYLYLRPWGYENLLPQPLTENTGNDKARKEVARYLGSRGNDFPDPQVRAVLDWQKKNESGPGSAKRKK